MSSEKGLYAKTQQSLQALRKLSLDVVVKDLELTLEDKPYTKDVLYSILWGGLQGSPLADG